MKEIQQNMIHTLEATNLSYQRENKIIFNNISFTLHSGDALIIQGSNGSGKTTLLECIAGLNTIYKGSILINNNLTTEKQRNTLIHYLDSTHLFTKAYNVLDTSIFWNVAYSTLKNNSYELFLNGLNMLGIPEKADLDVENLSLGQKKKLTLLRILLIPRPIWILDETLIGLDKNWTNYMEQILTMHRSQGGIVLIATHTNLKMYNSFNLKL
jgi:heme exporter protein A